MKYSGFVKMYVIANIANIEKYIIVNFLYLDFDRKKTYITKKTSKAIRTITPIVNGKSPYLVIKPVSKLINGNNKNIIYIAFIFFISL